jgi:hypothetical protein
VLRCKEQLRIKKSGIQKKLSWSALTKEELGQKRRQRYESNKAALNQKRRDRYRENAVEMREKKRQARHREKLPAEQQSVRRWLKWREQQQAAAKPGQPPPSASESVKNLLAFRESQKAIPSQSAAEKCPHERGFGGRSDNDDDVEDKRRKTNRSREDDFSL